MSYAITAEQLRVFIERIERQEEEKKQVSDYIREIYSEAKGQGYDTKILKQIIRLRRMEKDARDEEEALLDTYKTALGL
jgi:uncharacterized protein (UPF0335 family)